MLHCPNHLCQAPNPETYQFCQQCRTPLPHRYLWAVGGAEDVPVGEAIADRYLCKAPQVFLDTRPGCVPVALPGELPPQVDPYLRLSPYQLHVPQIYDLIAWDGVVLLLEGVAIAPASTASQSPAAVEGQYRLPLLSDRWSTAAALRQLNWLWQVAHLWQPLSLEKVASSLLDPALLLVEGGIIKLRELQNDIPGAEPSLVRLGKFWLEWVPASHRAIQPLLGDLCQQLVQAQISTTGALIQQLDQSIAAIGGQQSRCLHFATRTDQGPTRQRNEDACYPAPTQVYSQTFQQRPPSSPQPPTFVMVCDGIGGHQGGDVASSLAIEAVQRHLQSLRVEHLSPTTLMHEIEAAICMANDLISQRNDQEQRQDRQRMGTTVVLALMRQHELYIAHVGDSRAYRITRQGCHQVMLDDDLASREVRLGYSFYREALQNPTGGSLVQALGMSASSLLRPTVQRFILDEDCVFLLCSDGLSDHDRVEQYWDTEILPLLEDRTEVGAVSDRLITLANSLNGHDNVTVALLHCQVSAPPASLLPPEVPTWFQQNTALQESRATAVIAPPAPSKPDKTRARHWLTGLATLLMVLSAGGWLAYFLVPSLRQDNPVLPGRPEQPVGVNPVASPLPLNALVQVGEPTSPTSPAAPPLTLVDAPDPSPSTPVRGILSPGSVLRVLESQESGGDRWLKLQVCSIRPLDQSTTPSPDEEDSSPSASPQAPFTAQPFTRSLQTNDQGWIREAELKPAAFPNPILSAEQRGACPEPSPGSETLPGPPPSPSPQAVGHLDRTVRKLDQGGTTG